MNGVLIVAHGSREKQIERTVEAVVSMVQKKVDMPVETAYAEFSQNSIEAGLSRLFLQGIDNIKLVPYFLFCGIHISESIPKAVENFKKTHSGVTVTISKSLGEDERLADILVDRIKK